MKHIYTVEVGDRERLNIQRIHQEVIDQQLYEAKMEPAITQVILTIQQAKDLAEFLATFAYD
ncbi:MAG: hypothetical protein ACXACT_16865 [Candidatus Thorarchaeota archaeon]